MYNPEQKPVIRESFPLERHRLAELDGCLLRSQIALSHMQRAEAPAPISMPFDNPTPVPGEVSGGEPQDWLSQIRRQIEDIEDAA